MIINGDDPQVQSYDDTLEALLDVTWAGAVAPGAHIIAVASQSNFADGVDISAAYIVDHNLAPIMSTSFGSCEQTMGAVQTAFYNSLWQQAAAQGITSFVSAGDDGGAGCDSQSSGLFASQGLAVNGLASTPYNVAVGGTQFDDVANSDTYWSDHRGSDHSAVGHQLHSGNRLERKQQRCFLYLAVGGQRRCQHDLLQAQLADGHWRSQRRQTRSSGHFVSRCRAHRLRPLLRSKLQQSRFHRPLRQWEVLRHPARRLQASWLSPCKNWEDSPKAWPITCFTNWPPLPASTTTLRRATTKCPTPTANSPSAIPQDPAMTWQLVSVPSMRTRWSPSGPAASATAGSTTTLALGNGQATTVVHGTPITFKAKVTCTGSGCAAPTGAVALQSTGTGAEAGDFQGVGSAALTTSGSNGTATIASPNVPGGTYGVTARYSGDGKYYSSTSNSLNVTVTPEPSQMQMGGLAGGYYIETPLTCQLRRACTAMGCCRRKFRLWASYGTNQFACGRQSGQHHYERLSQLRAR